VTNNTQLCASGACPSIKEKKSGIITLSHGGGGGEMVELIAEIRSYFNIQSNWKNIYDDSASLLFKQGQLVFTTDSYVITPIFFPGGNIGKIAFCGTVNDLVVMGAKPLGISLSLILEDGFCKRDLFKIIKTIARLSREYNIPIVTGDTKVMEQGAIDGIVINTSGVGRADKVLDRQLRGGDHIIVSGGIGEHGAALLAKRFEMQTNLKTDSKPLCKEIRAIKKYIKQAKDITRGGLAAILNELAQKNKKQFFIKEKEIPVKQEVRALTEILGIEPYSLASEGCFVCICPKEKSAKVVKKLQEFNPLAGIIGKVKQGKGVIIQTLFGKRLLSMPLGNIVPRIC